MNLNFTKTIKFRLTVWYSLLLLSLAILFLFFANLTIVRYYNKPIEQPHRFLIKRQLIQLTPEQRRSKLLKTLRRRDLIIIREISLFSLIPLTFLSFASGYIIAGQMLKPIKHLNKSIKTTTAENLDKLVDFEDFGDEFSELANNFNSMITRLHQTFKGQKQFVQDASHELKTPLAIVQANLESIETDDLEIESKKSITTALNASAFMNSLVDNLLLLATLEQPIAMEEVDFVEIIHSVVHSLDLIAKKRDIQIELVGSDKLRKDKDKAKQLSCKNTSTQMLTKETIKSNVFPNEPIILHGNAVLLKEAISNLLENAIKYSPKGSSILISLEMDQNFEWDNNKTRQNANKGSNGNTGMKKVCLHVVDEGPGIPANEKVKIFERFYRIDKSRSREKGGTGLGLSIVKSIINAHNGEVEVTNNKPTGCIFTISLPTY